jgi:hypothetical protein
MSASAEASGTSLVDRSREMLETYGFTFVGVLMGLFVTEMVVLVTLIQFGVDLAPFAAWFHTTFGWDVSGILEVAGAVGVAYAITRLLKPFQIALAFVLTPIVARAWSGGSSN